MRSLVSVPLAALGLVVALAVSPAALAQAKPEAAPEQPPQIKQIALTEQQVRNLIAAQQDMSAITDKLPEDADGKPDPKVQAKLEAVVKNHGFANYDEFSDVAANVDLVMSGIDSTTKAFTQPPAALKKEIAAVQADKTMAEKDKKAMLADMNEALKYTAEVVYPENVALVTKYYEKLSALMQDNE